MKIKRYTFKFNLNAKSNQNSLLESCLKICRRSYLNLSCKSFHDNGMGHTLVKEEKGRRVPELCCSEAGSLACFSREACVGAHMLLAWFPMWDPLGPFYSLCVVQHGFWVKKEGVWHDLVDFHQKWKQCGTTSAWKVPTHGFWLEKETRCQKSIMDFHQKRKACAGPPSQNAVIRKAQYNGKWWVWAFQWETNRKSWVSNGKSWGSIPQGKIMGFLKSWGSISQWEVTVLNISTGNYGFLYLNRNSWVSISEREIMGFHISMWDCTSVWPTLSWKVSDELQDHDILRIEVRRGTLFSNGILRENFDLIWH